ncbi:MAG: DUF2156 domain-containing protein [Clostridia bacterium]|nr:DUF2156 domain-containing protein [Clostridia bacterium]
MLDLQHLKIQHKGLIEKYIPRQCSKMCDFSFGNLYAWSAAEHTEFAEKDGFLYLRSTFNGVTSYAVPWGNGDIHKALAEVQKDAVEREADLSFYCVAEEQLPVLKSFFGDKLVVKEQRDYFDYVYLRENLATLKGRKFHSKRNHVNSFCKKYNYVYEELSENNLRECLDFSHSWHIQGESTQRLEAERQVIDKAFRNFTKLGLSGALLRVDGQIVAYAMGEPMIDGETYCVHFEKASPSYPQAYAAINKLFAENSLKNYKYINREDDAGVEGLRKAKTSYQPEILVKKYYAKII